MQSEHGQQDWLRMGHNLGQIPESAAQAVGKGLENHHIAHIGGENAQLRWKEQTCNQSCQNQKGDVICDPIVKLRGFLHVRQGPFSL